MSVQRTLTVSAIALVLVGAGLLAWSVAPDVEGFDAPREVLALDGRTGPSGNSFGSTPFATLVDQGGTYRLEVTSDTYFVVGERRTDRPDDPIREAVSNGYNAGGDYVYDFETEFVSTARDASDPSIGPKEFFIKFPAASGTPTFDAVATFTPASVAALVALKAYASIVGLALAGVGLGIYLVRASMPRPPAAAPEPEAPAAPETEEPPHP